MRLIVFQLQKKNILKNVKKYTIYTANRALWNCGAIEKQNTKKQRRKERTAGVGIVEGNLTTPYLTLPLDG